MKCVQPGDEEQLSSKHASPRDPVVVEAAGQVVDVDPYGGRGGGGGGGGEGAGLGEKEGGVEWRGGGRRGREEEVDGEDEPQEEEPCGVLPKLVGEVVAAAAVGSSPRLRVLRISHGGGRAKPKLC